MPRGVQRPIACMPFRHSVDRRIVACVACVACRYARDPGYATNKAVHPRMLLSRQFTIARVTNFNRDYNSFDLIRIPGDLRRYLVEVPMEALRR